MRPEVNRQKRHEVNQRAFSVSSRRFPVYCVASPAHSRLRAAMWTSHSIGPPRAGKECIGASYVSNVVGSAVSNRAFEQPYS
jgi:hypothetical protein